MAGHGGTSWPGHSLRLAAPPSGGGGSESSDMREHTLAAQPLAASALTPGRPGLRLDRTMLRRGPTGMLTLECTGRST